MTFTKQLIIAGMLLGILSSAYADNGGLERTRNFYDNFKSEQERLRADKAANQDDKSTRNPEKENNEENRNER